MKETLDRRNNLLWTVAEELTKGHKARLIEAAAAWQKGGKKALKKLFASRKKARDMDEIILARKYPNKILGDLTRPITDMPVKHPNKLAKKNAKLAFDELLLLLAKNKKRWTKSERSDCNRVSSFLNTQ